MRFTTRRGLLWIGISFAVGFILAIVLCALSGLQLPGASLIAGVITGMYANGKFHSRPWMQIVVIVGCGIVGLFGWLDALPITHWFAR